jgi:Skp family chaperone for outer membrane proteins
MELLVSQYKENGDKILDQLAQKREEEKADMLLNLDKTKREIVAIYTDVRGLSDRLKHNIELSPVSGLEKQWQKDREAAQRRIDEGRLASAEGSKG